MDHLLLHLAFLILFILLSIWAWKDPKKDRFMAPNTFPSKKTQKNELYGRLLCQVLGDRQKAARLIKYAQDKTPGLTEEQYIEIASTSLERDITRWD